MGSDGYAAVLSDGFKDQVYPCIRYLTVYAQGDPVSLDRDISSFNARYHHKTELPAESLRFGLREEAAVISYCNGIDAGIPCLLYHLPRAVNRINRPPGMYMEIDFHIHSLREQRQVPVPSPFPAGTWRFKFVQGFLWKPSGLTRSTVKLPVRSR